MAFPTDLTNAVNKVTKIIAEHINALEAKVGIDSSAIATSLDYLVKNVLSINPGHRHSKLYASGGSITALEAGATGVVAVPVDIGVTEVDYGSTSTVVGWTTFTSKDICVKKIGKTVFVRFQLIGVSNSTVATFTLPYPIATDKMHDPTFINRFYDNGGAYGIGMGICDSDLQIIDLYAGAGLTAWTNSGTKAAKGQFFYETP